MNAVMPGHSPLAQPYGGILSPEEGVDSLPVNDHYANSNAINNNNNNDNAVPADPNERNNSANNGEIPTGHNHQRHSSSSSSGTPPEYLQQQQNQLRSPVPQMRTSPLNSPMGVNVPSSPPKGHGGPAGPPPFGLGAPSPPIGGHLFPNPVTASYPWSVGSTDGSFAIVTLQQQQQQIQLQQQQQIQHQELQRRQQLAMTANNDHNSSLREDDGSNDPVGGATIADGNDQNVNQNTLQGAPGGPLGGQALTMESHAKAQQAIAQSAAIIQSGRSLHHDQLFHQSSSAVEGVLAASCDVMGFDIAEMWLRTGLKTHQLTNSHLRPTALQDSVRQDLVDVYYGEKSNERTHRLSPALCKQAKDANDVVWVTAHTQNGAEALRMSISNVRTAVAVPVCHEASNTNVTIIYFSIRRIVVRPAAVEFLIHMSLSAAVTSVNALALDGLIDRDPNKLKTPQSGSFSTSATAEPSGLSKSTDGRRSKSGVHTNRPTSRGISYQRVDKTSITGARLDLQWRQLLNVEYLTDGGNSWIHTAVFDGKPVVVKTLRPECQDTAVAINEIEAEVAVHSRLNHPNIVSLIGAGWTSKKARFIVLERLDGGTLTQMLGYDTRIRDRRRRFWRKKQLPYLDVLRCARSLACAMQYCNEKAVIGSMVLHRDLKPDNIGFTLDGKVKLLDFGLARLLENADPKSNDCYEMSGETGSLRYMAPEVAEGLPYNHKSDVYSFGIIFWEMNAGKRPFGGLSRDTFYEQVVHGGGRPHLSKRWPSELNKLLGECWNADVDIRPTFSDIVDRIDDLLTNEKGAKHSNSKDGGKKKTLQRLTGIIDRHSTWF